MRYLEFLPCLTDPDVWMCASTNSDGYKYWGYIIVHSDYLLVISHCTNLVMKGFDTVYTLKPDAKGKKWAKPMTYLGADIEKFQVPYTGEACRSMSSNNYIKEALKNVDLEFAKYRWKMFKTSRLPIKPGYRPALDMSLVLEYYQSKLLLYYSWAADMVYQSWTDRYQFGNCFTISLSLSIQVWSY